MSEHSKLPWFVYDFSGTAVSAVLSTEDVTISCGQPGASTVAYMGRGLTATLEEARTNAALIVNAVNLHEEMVEALRDVETYLDSYIDELAAANIYAAYSKNVLAVVRSALAKASPTPRKVPDPTGSER